MARSVDEADGLTAADESQLPAQRLCGVRQLRGVCQLELGRVRRLLQLPTAPSVNGLVDGGHDLRALHRIDLAL